MEGEMASVREQAALVAAEQLAESCVRILNYPVRSVLLNGSLASTDFVPGQSDIDLLMIVDQPLSAAEIGALEATVRRADLGSASGIDLHVVTADVAAAPTKIPRMELHLGRYPGVGLEVEPKVEVAPDLPAELAMARAQGRRLLGAEPREVLGVMRPEWLWERGEHWLATWKTRADDTEHAQFMVLTACRIWRFCIEGVHSSKTQAARWALARDGSLTAVGQALHQRLVDPRAAVDEEGIRRLLDTVHGEVKRRSRVTGESA
jgi:predicted nucleotidyltransferase